MPGVDQAFWKVKSCYMLQVYLIGNDAEVRPFVRMCHSIYDVYFSWTIYITEGALLAFGAFLAWETRHVSLTFPSRLMTLIQYPINVDATS